MPRSSSTIPSVAIVTAVLIALLAIPGPVIAQDAEPAEPVEMAKVRILHGSEHGPIDAYLGGEIALEGLELGQITDYMDVPAGKLLVDVVGQGSVLDDAKGLFATAEATFKLKANAAYTVVANASDASGVELLIIGDRPKPAAGKAMVRVVGGICEACGQLDYAVEGSKKLLAKNLHHPDQRFAGKYIKMKPGELDVVPRGNGTTKPLADFDPVVLEPGTSNSLFVIGRQDRNTLTLVPAVDAALAKMRVLNAAIEPHAVDVYIDNKKVTKKLAQEQAGPFKDILSGEHWVQVVEAGADPADGTLSESTITLGPGTVSAVVVGLADPISVAPAPNGAASKVKESRMRFAHVAPDVAAMDILIDDVLVVEGLEFGAASDYVGPLAADAFFQMRPAGTADTVVQAPLSPAPRTSYTGFIAGSLDDSDLTLAISEDPKPKKKKKKKE